MAGIVCARCGGRINEADHYESTYQGNTERRTIYFDSLLCEIEYLKTLENQHWTWKP